jgi:hypothetical protein|tara:strand:- start:178 stop:360 length:183 start_codon:yes stop_codon:yes gene_type:complete
MKAMKVYGRSGSGIINYPSEGTSGKPTGQGYGAARKGPAVQGTIEAQVKEESKEYKTENA